MKKLTPTEAYKKMCDDHANALGWTANMSMKQYFSGYAKGMCDAIILFQMTDFDLNGNGEEFEKAWTNLEEELKDDWTPSEKTKKIALFCFKLMKEQYNAVWVYPYGESGAEIVVLKKVNKDRYSFIVDNEQWVSIEQGKSIMELDEPIGEPTDEAYIALAEACEEEGMVGIEESEEILNKYRTATEEDLKAVQEQLANIKYDGLLLEEHRFVYSIDHAIKEWEALRDEASASGSNRDLMWIDDFLETLQLLKKIEAVNLNTQNTQNIDIWDTSPLLFKRMNGEEL